MIRTFSRLAVSRLLVSRPSVSRPSVSRHKHSPRLHSRQIRQHCSRLTVRHSMITLRAMVQHHKVRRGQNSRARVAKLLARARKARGPRKTMQPGRAQPQKPGQLLQLIWKAIQMQRRARQVLMQLPKVLLSLGSSLILTCWSVYCASAGVLTAGQVTCCSAVSCHSIFGVV